jgi:Golgi apparatus protein 1
VHKCLREHSKELSETCRREELRLEQSEAETIELNQGLLKACRDERALFCKEVAPGQARVFRCLAENLGNADYGDACKYQVVMKLQRRCGPAAGATAALLDALGLAARPPIAAAARPPFPPPLPPPHTAPSRPRRQSNWRLDPPLRKACKDDVAAMCGDADAKRSENGLVFKCLIGNYTQLVDGCQRELGRSVHMAFFIWSAGGGRPAPPPRCPCPCSLWGGAAHGRPRPSHPHRILTAPRTRPPPAQA